MRRTALSAVLSFIGHVVSPDGSALAYAWAPDAILNDADFATVRIVDVATRKAHPLTARRARERDPLFSPDGKDDVADHPRDSDRYIFRGSPFIARNRARWVHEQSITYVANATTPVLLIADRVDARVPNVSSYEFFHALRDLRKPVQFVVYPVDGHFPHDPARTADVYARWMNYIGDHFTL
jgi:hypothetical protein